MYKLHKLIRKATLTAMLLLIVVGTADTVSADYKAESTEHPRCSMVRHDIVFRHNQREDLVAYHTFNQIMYWLTENDLYQKRHQGVRVSIEQLDATMAYAYRELKLLECNLVPKLLP